MVEFEKAFGSVFWTFIEKVLDIFTFGPDIKQWVKAFYANASTCVSVNGHYSSWFNIGRGVRQGDPLSPYLCLVCAEVLSIMIRQKEQIKGMNIHNKEILLSQFADDTTLCLDGSEESFYEISAGTLVFLQSWVLYSQQMSSRSLQSIMKENWQKLRGFLNTWSKRQISPLGKITGSKTLALALSRLIYLFGNRPDPPDDFLHELNMLLFQFLWDGKQSTIGRKIVCQSYEDGGLGMVDVFTVLSCMKIAWLRRLMLENSSFGETVFKLFPNSNKLKLVGNLQMCVCSRYVTLSGRMF